MKPALVLVLEWYNALTEAHGIHTVRYVKSTPTAARRAAQNVILEWISRPGIIVDAARLDRVSDEETIWVMRENAAFLNRKQKAER